MTSTSTELYGTFYLFFYFFIFLFFMQWSCCQRPWKMHIFFLYKLVSYSGYV